MSGIPLLRRRSRWAAVALPAAACLAAAAALSACTGADPAAEPAPVDCAALSDSLFPAAQRTGLAAFKVVEPNGGTFKAGGKMRVVVAGVDYTGALVDLVVKGPRGGAGRVPGFPATNSIKPRETCVFEFAVPESLATTQGTTIPLISDSVKVRISDYTDPDSYDFSDAFFSITR